MSFCLSSLPYEKNCHTITSRCEFWCRRCENIQKHIQEKCFGDRKTVRVEENCSFTDHLAMLKLSEEDYTLALRSNLRRHKVFLRRNLSERNLNQYNRDILNLWDANSDLQFIQDP